MFLKFWQNPVGLSVVLALWFLFILGLLWARRKDKRDALMVSDFNGTITFRIAVYINTFDVSCRGRICNARRSLYFSMLLLLHYAWTQWTVYDVHLFLDTVLKNTCLIWLIPLRSFLCRF